MKLASPSDCTGCLACVDSCRHGAIDYQYDKNGYVSISVNNDKCVGCGLCSKHCPIISPIKKSTCVTPDCFFGWNNDLQQRKLSSSGGLFSAIATYFLKQGGIVYGAAIDGFEVRHIRIDSLCKLPLIQGSKYQHSILKGVYESVRLDLKSNKLVLFSGVGCQINALLSYLGNKNYDNLFTIDMICGGVSSILPILEYKKTNKYNSIMSFRDKDNGWVSHDFSYALKLKKNNGEIENFGACNLVTQSFNTKLAKRDSCLSCRFTGVSRNSDCTIGDYWGINLSPQEEHDGISAILVHSEKFKTLLENIDITIKTTTWGFIAKKNPCLYFSNFSFIRFFISRKLLLYALRHQKRRLAYCIITQSQYNLEMRLYNRYIEKRKKILYTKLSEIFE